ncbi:3-methyl-2-oxobutanoate hydroxymethyltransferase [Sanguibacter antarcticus]|uniref:3-methyl-2-oxobutanoate hydroxymethyltransferase n=1 Tax=Sanguibacter antarcticus TaxID=372484 RepID=A0A2A9E1Z5_9MICO|nr:3-methyl-2-oxobutanoate hydroxymethyltransferase [Sanguibacter antarcticus]PFG32863.1 ketopantoate hydroxymethyltransferase [Sanguibacter antarcticus]
MAEHALPSTPGPSSTPGTTPGAPGEVPTRKRFRVHHLIERKAAGEKLTMLTAYDSITGRIFDEAGIDLILVGDSMGDNVLGHATTIPVTLDELIVAARSVARAAKHAMVVADLPFGAYEASPQHAHASAVRMLKEAEVHAVKIEGGARIAPHVELLTGSGIPVFGHLGFTPQSENMLGGKRIQGRGDEAAERLCADALALQEAGAVCVVLEMVPAPLAARVTEILRIPTIGIGAGSEVDGQVLVWTDMAGIGDWSPRFAKQFGQVGAALAAAAHDYVSEVRSATFPGPEHQYDH